MKIFVTGGTGLLGNTIIRQLIDAGDDVIALCRTEPDGGVFDGLNVEVVLGDLSDQEQIEDAIARCDGVIHSAGLIHFGWTRLKESMRVNRDGTRLIVNACIKHDCRMVHVGTVNTLAVGSKAGAGDEETPLNNAGGQVPCSYVLSKRAGVEEVLEGVERGLRAVIVHPGFMLGPWDWKPSSGRMMLEVGKGWKPLAPAGGCSVCDSRDVATATIHALRAGGDDGRQFILAGENVDYKTLWTEMAKRMGTRPPIMRLGPLMRVIGGLGGDLWARISKNEGLVNSAGIRMSSCFHWHDSSRAQSELQYQTRSIGEILDDSSQWLKLHQA